MIIVIFEPLSLSARKISVRWRINGREVHHPAMSIKGELAEQARRATSMTITEIVHAASRPHVGASEVTVRDRGQTTTETDHDGTTREVSVRDFDVITIRVRGQGNGVHGEIIIERSDVGDPWRYEVIPPPGVRLRGIDPRGVVVGPGGVENLVRGVRTSMGLSPRVRTPEPSVRGWSNYQAVRRGA